MRNDTAEFERLRVISAQLGRDPLLVQAAGGNTSIKVDGIMWIKASGTWLRDATAQEIFVPLDLKALSQALAEDDPRCENCSDFVLAELNPAGLRPSIETSVHGLMPQRVVLHVHCVNSIAWMIQQRAKQAVVPRLAGLHWALVPYARPGLQLCRAIRPVVSPDTNVLLLQNHGLVVAADSVADAQGLLCEVVDRLRLPSRQQGQADLAKLQTLSEGTDYRPATDLAAHGFALNAAHFHNCVTRVFYPDHAVFLGPQIETTLPALGPAVAIAGAGVLVRKDAKEAVEPMLVCLTEVFARIEDNESLHPLSPTDIAALLDWDAEKYRQTLKLDLVD